MGNELNKKEEKTNYKMNQKKKLPKNKYNIVFVGACAIGAKTTLIQKIYKINDNDNDENASSIIISDSICKHVNIGNNKEIILKLWDTAGEERYKSITCKTLRYADCIILGYDITRRKTFYEVKEWLNEIYENCSYNFLKYLIGNKIDLEERRQVSEEEAILLAESENLRFFETSCVTNIGINEFYNDLINNIIELHKNNNREL